MDPNIKLARAKQRLDELQTWIDKYFSVVPYKVATRINSEQRPEYYLCDVVPVPLEITLLVCEVVQNLRSSLDHLAYKAFKANLENTLKDGPHIYFPIAESAEKYEEVRDRQTEGLPQIIKDQIDSYRPYKEGNLLLWQMHKLNNIDKHRLPLTVGSRNSGVDIMPTLLETMSTVLDVGRMDDLKKQMKPLFLQPTFDSTLKKGDVLFVDLPGKRPTKIEFQFFVAFNESGVIMGEEIKMTLDAMYSEVLKIVTKINAMLSS